MWYFTWVLGVGFACAFAILNALWLEARPGGPHVPSTRVNDVDHDFV
jgi:cytochrome bd-I ubiquinol oxidase subunit X